MGTEYPRKKCPGDKYSQDIFVWGGGGGGGGRTKIRGDRKSSSVAILYIVVMMIWQSVIQPNYTSFEMEIHSQLDVKAKKKM